LPSDCGRCHRTSTARPAGVFAEGLFGNQLLTHLALEHYVQGVTLGQLLALSGAPTARKFLPLLAKADRLNQQAITPAGVVRSRTDELEGR